MKWPNNSLLHLKEKNTYKFYFTPASVVLPIRTKPLGNCWSKVFQCHNSAAQRIQILLVCLGFLTIIPIITNNRVVDKVLVGILNIHVS